MTHEWECIVGTAFAVIIKSKDNNDVQLVVYEVNEDRDVREEKQHVRQEEMC